MVATWDALACENPARLVKEGTTESSSLFVRLVRAPLGSAVTGIASYPPSVQPTACQQASRLPHAACHALGQTRALHDKHCTDDDVQRKLDKQRTENIDEALVPVSVKQSFEQQVNQPTSYSKNQSVLLSILGSRGKR